MAGKDNNDWTPYYVEILRKHLLEIQQNAGTCPMILSTFSVCLLQNFFEQTCLKSLTGRIIVQISIGNLWSIVKRNVEKWQPKNLNDLRRFMVEDWDNIPDTIIIIKFNRINKKTL